MKNLYLLFRRSEHPELHERTTEDGWNLVGVVKDYNLLEQIEELDRKRFGENAKLEYWAEEIYTDL